MTRREAAQILGVRESAGEERVKDAHRKLMVANHPDSGMHCCAFCITFDAWWLHAVQGAYRTLMAANRPGSGCAPLCFCFVVL